MEAFVEHEIPQGLGKKSVVVLPFAAGSLVISVPYDGNSIYYGHPHASNAWISGKFTPNDGYGEIEIADELAGGLFANLYHEGEIVIRPEFAQGLRCLVLLHRHNGLIARREISETERTIRGLPEISVRELEE